MTLLDSGGRRVARVDIAALRSSIVPKDMEIARGDLARILHEASANDADYIFGDSIKALTQDEMGADVTFEHSRPRRFDLVIGADGLHSIVRRLAFGADSEFVQHAGLYAATISLPGSTDNEGEMFMLNTPGRLAVRGIAEGGLIDIHTDLVIGADGRHSTVRKRAGLKVDDLGAPMDVLWMRISRSLDIR
jgi:2-polyprenyl-6-methoxyphenol hydroxylase-like FAD-dependent oxidoreductase